MKIQHNVLHHVHDVDGLDEDIDMHPIMRFSPLPRHWWHRFQHIYSWVFYAMMTIFWMIAKDWMQLRRYLKDLIKPTGTTVGKLSVEMAKVAYFTYVLVLPMLFSGAHWLQVVAGWCVMQMVAGFLLAVIFQPARARRPRLPGERRQAGRGSPDPPAAPLNLAQAASCSPSCAAASTTN